MSCLNIHFYRSYVKAQGRRDPPGHHFRSQQLQLSIPAVRVQVLHRHLLEGGRWGGSINLLVLNAGNGWVAGGCWDDDITSDGLDHSLKFPT